MALDFGKGRLLIEVVPWLRDEDLRHACILDVTERDSVIEGLPPLSQVARQRILAKLRAIAAHPAKPLQ